MSSKERGVAEPVARAGVQGDMGSSDSSTLYPEQERSVMMVETLDMLL